MGFGDYNYHKSDEATGRGSTNSLRDRDLDYLYHRLACFATRAELEEDYDFYDGDIESVENAYI